MCDFLRQIDQAMQNYSIVKLAQFWRSFSLFITSSLPRRNFVLHGSFLLKIYTYLPKLMSFQIPSKDFVRNVYLEDVWANTDGPLLLTCFGGRRKCGLWWAIMPWFQGPARWELVNSNLSYSPETPNRGQIRRLLKLCDLEIWRMSLKNNRAPLLCNITLYVSFHHHMWI